LNKIKEQLLEESKMLTAFIKKIDNKDTLK
jgi:hypothetical protein